MEWRPMCLCQYIYLEFKRCASTPCFSKGTAQIVGEMHVFQHRLEFPRVVRPTLVLEAQDHGTLSIV